MGGPLFEQLVAMTESPRLTTCCRKYLLSVVLAPTNHTGSTAELPPREGRKDLRRGQEALARGLVYLSLMCYLCHIHYSKVKNAGIFTPAKIYTREI